MAEAKPPDPSQDWGAIDIFLFSNGQEYSPPRKYHLTADELNWWDKTLGHLARTQYGGEKMHKTVELYTLNGKRIQSPMELRDGVTYVAVSPNEKFVQAGYEQYLIKASRSREKRERRRNAGLDEEGSDEETAPGPSGNTYRRIEPVIPTSSCHSRSVEPYECLPIDPSLHNLNPDRHPVRSNATDSCCSCSADAAFYNSIDSSQGLRSGSGPQMCSALPTGCCSDLPSIDCPKPVLPAQRQRVQAKDSPAMIVIKITEIITYNDVPRIQPSGNTGNERREMINTIDPEQKLSPKTVPERRQMPNLQSERRPVDNFALGGRPTCDPCHCPPMMGTNNIGRGSVADHDGTERVLCSPCNDPNLAQENRSNEISAHPKIQPPPRINEDTGEWVLCSPCNDTRMLPSYSPMNNYVPDRNTMASNNPRGRQIDDSKERQTPEQERHNRDMYTNKVIPTLNGNPGRQIDATAVTPRSGNMTNADPAKVPRVTSAWASSDSAPVTHSSFSDEPDNTKERLSSETRDTQSSQDNTSSRPKEVGVVIKDFSDDEIGFNIHDSLLDMSLDHDDEAGAFSDEKLPAPDKNDMKIHLLPNIPREEGILDSGVPDSENSFGTEIGLAPIKTNGENLDNIDKLSNSLKASLGSGKPERKRLSSQANHRSSLDKPRLSSVISSPTPVRKSSASTSRKESSSTPANLKLAKPINVSSVKSSKQPKLPHLPISSKGHPKNESTANAVVDETNENADLIVISDAFGNTDSEVTSISIDTETPPKTVRQVENESMSVDKKYRKSVMHEENNFLPILEETIPNKDKNSPEDQVTWATLLKAKNLDKKRNYMPKIKKGSQVKTETSGEIFSENIKTFSTINKTNVTNIKCNTPPPSLVSKPSESAEKRSTYLKQKLCSKLGSKQNYDDVTTISGQFLESLYHSLSTDSSELHKNAIFPPIGFDVKHELAGAAALASGVAHANSKKKRSISETVLTNTTLEQIPISLNSNGFNDVVNTTESIVNPEKRVDLSQSRGIVDNKASSNLIENTALEKGNEKHSSNLKWAPASVYTTGKKNSNDTPKKGSIEGTETKKLKEFKRSEMTYDYASSGSEVVTNSKQNSNIPHLKTVKPKVNDKGSLIIHQPKSKNVAPLHNTAKPKPVPNQRPSQFVRSVIPVPTINISQILENSIEPNDNNGYKNQIKKGQVQKSLNPPGSRVMSNQATGNKKHTIADNNKLSLKTKPNSTASKKIFMTVSEQNVEANKSNPFDTENYYKDSLSDSLRKIDMLLLPELSDKKHRKDFLLDETTTTEPFVTVLTNAEILNLQLNLEVTNKEGTVTAKVNPQRSHSATDIKMGITEEAMGQSKSMDSIDCPPHICCQRNQKGQCACCDHFTHEDSGRNVLIDQDRKTYYILVPVTALTKKCKNQQKFEDLGKKITDDCSCGDEAQTLIKENNDMTEKEVQHSTSLSKINVITCARETSTAQIVSQDKTQNCNAQSSKTSIISQAVSKKVSICSEDKIITSQTEIVTPVRKSNSTSMGVTMQNKSVQTDTCNLIMNIVDGLDGSTKTRRWAVHIPPSTT